MNVLLESNLFQVKTTAQCNRVYTFEGQESGPKKSPSLHSSPLFWLEATGMAHIHMSSLGTVPGFLVSSLCVPLSSFPALESPSSFPTIPWQPLERRKKSILVLHSSSAATWAVCNFWHPVSDFCAGLQVGNKHFFESSVHSKENQHRLRRREHGPRTHWWNVQCWPQVRKEVTGWALTHRL